MPSSPHRGDITQLLVRFGRGDRDAEGELIPLVYAELRRLAKYYLRGEKPGHTLQPTALVNEVYIRLTQLNSLDWRGRSQFYGIAATMMRRILVDHARSRAAQKRGASAEILSLEDVPGIAALGCSQVLALDEALSRLAKRDARQSKIVELRFFVGLSEKEAAELLGISEKTVKRDWRIAKAWLFEQISN
jgi:RNA polymerase sigma factor (TIGR02999 family)